MCTMHIMHNHCRYQVKVHPAAQAKVLGNIRENPSIRIKGLSQVHYEFIIVL